MKAKKKKNKSLIISIVVCSISILCFVVLSIIWSFYKTVVMEPFINVYLNDTSTIYLKCYESDTDIYKFEDWTKNNKKFCNNISLEFNLNNNLENKPLEAITFAKSNERDFKAYKFEITNTSSKKQSFGLNIFAKSKHNKQSSNLNKGVKVLICENDANFSSTNFIGGALSPNQTVNIIVLLKSNNADLLPAPINQFCINLIIN